MTRAVGISIRPVPPQLDGKVKGSSAAKQSGHDRRKGNVTKKKQRDRQEVMNS
jgi:hypothetical protein